MKQRMTHQRMTILNYLKSVKTHPTAEMVYHEVAKQLPTITLATVYRNLNLLADSNQILRMEINKEFHYDADISLHQHCVCKKCGMIHDVFQKEISTYALNKLNAKFQPESVNIVFYGQCINC